MDNLVRLPSPRRVNLKQKYGKLVGGKSPKSIKRKLLEAANLFADGQNDHSINPDVTIEEDLMSQIRYQDNESMINQERLLEKLDGSAVLVETLIRHASKRSRKTNCIFANKNCIIFRHRKWGCSPNYFISRDLHVCC